MKIASKQADACKKKSFINQKITYPAQKNPSICWTLLIFHSTLSLHIEKDTPCSALFDRRMMGAVIFLQKSRHSIFSARSQDQGQNMKTQMLIYGWIYFYGHPILDWMDGFGNNYVTFLMDAECFFLLSGKLKYPWVHFSFLFDLFLANTDFKAIDDSTVTTFKKTNICQPLPQSFLRLLRLCSICPCSEQCHTECACQKQQGYCSILSPLPKI